MDPVQTQPINPLDIATAAPNRLQMLLRKKWFIALIVILVLVLFTFLFLYLAGSTQKAPTKSSLTPTPSLSVRQKKAISEQQKTDEEFADWERDNKENYPWISRLPIRTDRYFAYFDLNKKTFVGLLYPKDSENVEAMKAEVLKELRGIPVEDHKFEWIVSPK